MSTTAVPRVADLPLRPLVAVEPEASLRTAARVMREEDVSALVVGTPGSLVTILTERDVTAAVAAGRGHDTIVAELATRRPATVDADTTVVAAAGRMLDEGVRHLVVARGDRAVGLVSIRDLLGVLLQAVTPEAILLLVGGLEAEAARLWLGGEAAAEPGWRLR